MIPRTTGLALVQSIVVSSALLLTPAAAQAQVNIPAGSVVGIIPSQSGTGLSGSICSTYFSSIAGSRNIIATTSPAGSFNATAINYTDSSISTPL